MKIFKCIHAVLQTMEEEMKAMEASLDDSLVLQHRIIDLTAQSIKNFKNIAKTAKRNAVKRVMRFIHCNFGIFNTPPQHEDVGGAVT